MPEIRIGFTGAGYIAGIHAQGLAALPGVRIAAVHDPNGEHAAAFASAHGASQAPSFEALLDACDAVYVCSPNVHHASMACSALEAGLHVFSEKPMATSPEEARRVAAAADRASGVYQVGFNKRYAAIYARLKERIDAGTLQPKWANMKMNRGELLKPSWVGDISHTGGYLYETPIHLLDMACWLFGPATEVVCRAAQHCAEGLDDFAMILTFASGVTATLTSCAHATWLFPYERVEVYGEHTIAVTEEMERVTFQSGLDAEPETLDVTELPVPERWGYAAEDAAFIAAIRGERDPRAAGAAEGLAAVELVDACYRAAESGQPVRL